MRSISVILKTVVIMRKFFFLYLHIRLWINLFLALRKVYLQLSSHSSKFRWWYAGAFNKVSAFHTRWDKAHCDTCTEWVVSLLPKGGITQYSVTWSCLSSWVIKKLGFFCDPYFIICYRAVCNFTWNCHIRGCFPWSTLNMSGFFYRVWLVWVPFLASGEFLNGTGRAKPWRKLRGSVLLVDLLRL